MLPILNNQQIRKWDAFTIENEPITSIALMERACQAFLLWFTKSFPVTGTVGIVCGQGNNGGDGMGIARMLGQRGYPVEVWIVVGRISGTKDFEQNKKLLPDTITCHEITEKADEGLFSKCTLLIDALFGSGLSKPVTGLYAAVIHAINRTPATRIAIDMPSGLFSDQPSSGSIVNAHHTISFHIPKLAFMMPENEPYVGSWGTVDIGLSKAYQDTINTSRFLITQNSARKYMPKRTKFAHKGNFGHTLIIAGSKGKMGASIFASRAASRVGAGLLTAHVPKEGYTVMQTAVPEAMVSVDRHKTHFTCCPDTTPYNTIAIGPGLGQSADTANALATLFERFRHPVVIDADALNLLAAHRALLHLVPAQSILTPHPRELERLTGSWKNDFERLNKAQRLAQQTLSFVIVKGAHSAICTPDGKVYFNNTGNAGMATGGSGDVLTGMLVGLLSSRLSPLHAAIVGVHLHGMAGDLAAERLGQYALIASDIIDHIPLAFNILTA